MNKIEKLHFEAIVESEFSGRGHSEGQELAASKSAEITEQIAIEFAEWLTKELVSSTHARQCSDAARKLRFHHRRGKLNKELFQEFLKTKQ